MPRSKYYRELGLSTNASEQEVRKKYRRLVMKYHPDKNSQPGAEEMFKKINQAYSNIKSPPLSRYSSYPY